MIRTKFKTTSLLCFLVLLNCPLWLSAQFFTEVTSIRDSLASFRATGVDWGDYDNDGDLDILLAGQPQGAGQRNSTVFRNDGNGTFTDIQAGMSGVFFGTADWGDYDNDGFLDILITGNKYGGPRIAEVYHNDSGTGFSFANVGLSGVSQGDGEWGDYDNDGDLDILITGGDNGTPPNGSNSNPSFRIYQNNGGSFTDVTTNIPGYSLASAAWGDYDKDGDLDIVVCGSQLNNPWTTTIYRNDGGSFAVQNLGLAGIYFGDVTWGDYDNDGDLDLLLSGEQDQSDWEYKSLIYRNDQGTFTDIQAGLAEMGESAVAFGDFDNDGDLDLMIAGFDYPNESFVVYRNDGGTFVQIYAGIPGLKNPALAWGDFDNDQDLDILVSGYSYSQGRITTVYRNDSAAGNSAPLAPNNLTVSSHTIRTTNFRWNRANDAETPSDGLSYRLWIGTNSSDYDVCSPMADTATGWRTIASIGNLQDTSWTLIHSTLGQTYFACVSAVDAGLRGSPCSNQVSTLTVGLSDPDKTVHFAAGPNPTHDLITVVLSNRLQHRIKYALTDLSGKRLTGFSGTFSNQLKLDLSALSKGIYLLQMESPEFKQGASLRIIRQ